MGLFRGENVYPLNVKTNRTSYTLTATDISNGYANIPVVWDSPFTDASYTIAQGITQATALDTLNDVSPGDNHLVTRYGFTAQIYVNGSVTGTPTIVLNTIGIHDLFLQP
jgi:hypothetical protein